MVGENEAIYMAKSHTPGSVMQPLHNSKISVYQLDTAYDTLVSESRTAIATVEQAISDYIADDDGFIKPQQHARDDASSGGGK